MTGRADDVGPADERLREAFASLAELDAPTGDCFDPDRIWDAARGHADPAEVARIADHLLRCGVCAEAWRLAVALPADDELAAAPTADEVAPVAGSTAPAAAARPGRDDVVPLHDPARARRRSPWVRYGAVAATGLAMAAAVVLLVRGRGGSPARVDARLYELEVVPAGPPHRAGMAAAGDRLRVRATARDGTHAELRVYREGRELVAQCPSPSGPAAGCERRGDRISVELTLPRIGAYRVALLTSPSPLPPPTGSLDRDSTTPGVEVQLSDVLEVM